jgi:hypothetical protein
MQLLKKREFSDFFTDTFQFIKVNGKHFFKNYLIVNGVFLLILMTFLYFFTKFYSNFINAQLITQQESEIELFFNENGPLAIALVFFFVIIAMIASIINYSYTPLYLNLYVKNEGSTFSSTDLFNSLKQNIGKILLFILASIIVAIPVTIAAAIGMFAVMITIIGIPLVLMVIAVVVLFYQHALMEYVRGERGVFESFGYSLNLLPKKFWHTAGCVSLFILMSYIVQLAISMIQMIFTGASMYSLTPETQNDLSESSGLMITGLLVTYLISFIVSSLLGLIMQINQGIIFYSLKEETENINTKSIIDQIGSGE